MQTHPTPMSARRKGALEAAHVAQASLPARATDGLLSTHLRTLADEAARLEAEGLHPIGAGIRAGRPCIELAVCSRLARLASMGQAAYYGHGNDDDGPWRRGVLLRRPVTVLWTERGN